MNKWIPLYHCLACRSFCNPSGYREDDARLREDLDFHLSVEKRNREYARTLFQAILAHRRTVKTVLEVGCGTGSALLVGRDEFGLEVEGFDINAYAAEWGREKYSLNLHGDSWKPGKSGDSDLTLCISCLEHLDRPRDLIGELTAHTVRSRGLLFISVPFISPGRWHFIDDPAPDREGTPFFDNDVHVTHFSHYGLLKAVGDCGLSYGKLLAAGGWSGFLFDASPGMPRRLRNRLWRGTFKARQEREAAEHLRPGRGSSILRGALQGRGSSLSSTP
jgi:SAM-dependent methyltransferase